jgi:Domain of unknown function (DUF4192)/Protein of unknown function (DUF3085)
MPDIPTPSVQLRFPVTEVLRIAEDAATATEHRTRWEPGPTFDQPGYDVDGGPCLMLVCDDGVYLMSTSKNTTEDAEDGRVCYASGFDPRIGDWRSNWASTGLPGDDFAEYLEVLESGLLEDLRAAAEHGYRWFVIGLAEDRLSISFERGTPEHPAVSSGTPPAREGATMPTSSDPPTPIKLRSPADVVALVPYLLGFHPSQSLCLIGLNDSKLTCAIRYDLPEADDIGAFTDALTSMVADKPIKVMLLAGYGTDAEVTPALTATLDALAAIEIPVADAVRAEEGRYFPYLCGDETCCPPEGTPYEIDTSAAAAAAVTAGLSALPDRSYLAARITPQQGTARAAVETATARATADIEQQMREPGGLCGFISEVRDTITTALDLYRDGGKLSDEDAARLSVFLGVIRLRDEAWATITLEVADSQLALWTDMTRRASINVAACASLLAFTAWLTGDGAFANIAVERATDADPEYTMAHLLNSLLAVGLPPTAVAEMMPTAEDLAANDPSTCSREGSPGVDVL